jgi:hypothetical protein
MSSSHYLADGQAESRVRASLVTGSEAEEQTRNQLVWLLQRYDLARWCFTEVIQRRAHLTYATVLALCLLAAPASAAAGAVIRAHMESWFLFSSAVRTAAVHRAECLPPSCPM